MTDKEAYDLFVKYSGESGVAKIREMILMAGVSQTVKNICHVYQQKGLNVTPEFKRWVEQSVSYINMVNLN